MGDTVPPAGAIVRARGEGPGGAGDPSWSQPPAMSGFRRQMWWRAQVRGGNKVSAGFGAEEVVAEERRATVKLAVGAAWWCIGRWRHATRAQRREAEMGSGVGLGNLGK